MIVIDVKLVSAIAPSRNKLLGRAIIGNVGGTRERGDYRCAVGKKGRSAYTEVWKNPLREGSVKGYPRLSYNVWRLVIRALRSAFPEEDRRGQEKA